MRRSAMPFSQIIEGNKRPHWSRECYPYRESCRGLIASLTSKRMAFVPHSVGNTI
jgi:hypothetical protein